MFLLLFTEKDVTSGKLNIMKWRAPSGEKKVLRLKEEMSIKWRELGQNVGISDAKLTDFQDFFLRSNGKCMDSVSQKWIKKGSHQKVELVVLCLINYSTNF